MKKIISVFLVCLMALGSLIGCSNTDSETKTKESGDSIELSWYYPVNVGGAITEVIDKLAKEFNESGTEVNGKKVTVKPIYSGNYEETMTKVQTAVKNKKTPDLAVLLSNDLYQIKNSVQPLDDFIAKDEDLKTMIDDFFPAFLMNAQDEGETYSIPFQRSTVLLYYNKDRFKQAGLDPEVAPKTWEDIVTYGKKLTKPGQWGIELPANISVNWIYQALMLQSGNENLMSDDGKQVNFNTPAAKEALQYWVDLINKDKVMPSGILDWNTVPTDFIQGKTAMMLTTTGNLTNVKNNAKFDFGVAYLPANERVATPTGGGNFYIFKDTPEERQLAAMEFIKWMCTPERAAQWSIDTGYIATRQSSYETESLKKYTESFPQALTAMEQLEYAQKEFAVYEQGKINKILTDAIQAAINGADVDQELDQAQEKAEQILKKYQ
ncbi:MULTISPECIES: ABC transporter substrate-binding protein [Bacillus]|uniref:ABC transporter substrate-binding protein n=1 Tax=Bacillus TaxID=1386 RepID=UPI0002D7DB58|nr:MULTISPECIES: ABC transporter substrate-binding protein [Bacillus]